MNYLILACSGLDKPEGSVAREVAIRLAEEQGAEIVCPVVLNRTPARYEKTLPENKLIVVDGCATRCAAKLAAAAGAKIAQRVLVSETAKALGVTVEPGLRPGPGALELARAIVKEIGERENGAVQVAGAAQAAAGAVDAEAEAPAGAGAAQAEAGFEPATDHVLVVHDKYEFRIPLTGYFFNANDVWAQVSGSRARVGISDYLQQQLTDITYVDAPEVGTAVEQFGEAGEVESTKATFELISPVSGTVVRVNEAVTDLPEAINEDPYGSWIVELELTAWGEDQMLLLDGPAYAADVERKAAEY